jgi:hypothetical protein
MPRYEVTIIKTNDDGSHDATVLHTAPSEQDKGTGAFGVGFIYRYLRETKRKDAPSFFRFSIIEPTEAEELFNK